MRETTPDERHELMYNVLKELGAPKTYEEMVNTFSEYQRREMMVRYDDADPEHKKDIEKMATLYAHMGKDMFVYDYDAIHLLITAKDRNEAN
jgi:hypothetical protein